MQYSLYLISLSLSHILPLAPPPCLSPSLYIVVQLFDSNETFIIGKLLCTNSCIIHRPRQYNDNIHQVLYGMVYMFRLHRLSTSAPPPFLLCTETAAASLPPLPLSLISMSFSPPPQPRHPRFINLDVERERERDRENVYINLSHFHL